jgi:hypothetical protein
MDELVPFGRHRGDLFRRYIDIPELFLCRSLFMTLLDRVTAQGDHDPFLPHVFLLVEDRDFIVANIRINSNRLMAARCA